MAEQSPQTHEDMTDDDIAATLGFITTLSQQMMTPPEEGEEEDGETTSGDEEPVAEETTPEPEVNEPEVKDQQVLGEIRNEVADIKSQLEELLKEEDVKEDDPEQKTEN